MVNTLNLLACALHVYLPLVVLARRTSLFEASTIFNDKFETALHKASLGKDSRVATESPTREGEDEEDAYWKRQRDAHQLEELEVGEAFKEEQWKQISTAWKPTVRGFLCVQLDISLEGTVPGLAINVGLMGAIQRHSVTGCISMRMEVSLGVSWAKKMFGLDLGISGALTGSIDIEEVPVSRARKTGATDDLSLPDGLDETKCYSGDPWGIIMSWIEDEVNGFIKSPNSRRKTRIEYQRRLRHYEHAVSAYRGIMAGPGELRGLSRDEELPSEWISYKSLYGVPCDCKARDPSSWASVYTQANWLFLRKSARLQDFDRWRRECGCIADHTKTHSPKVIERLSVQAGVMHDLMRIIIRTLPSYAQQVMERVMDNSDQHGTDKERSWLNNDRLYWSRGRFLARWPSFGTLTEHGEEYLEGVTKDEVDDRVLNFPKTMRLASAARISHSFWLETAISASNLFVRIVGDIKAMFNVAFANDAAWDGFCNSLEGEFHASEALFQERLSHHRWASRSTRSKERLKFFTHPELTKTRTGSNPLVGILKVRVSSARPSWVARKPQGLTKQHGDWPTEAVLPHLWCTLATKEDEGTATDPSLESRGMDSGEYMEVIEDFTSEEPVIPSDTTSEDATVRRHAQRGPHGKSVFLRQACGVAKRTKGGWMLQSRMDCEQVLLSPAFVKMFPRFTETIERMILVLEEILFRINRCMGHPLLKDVALRRKLDLEGLPNQAIGQSPTRDMRGMCSSPQKSLQSVQELAQEAVRMVRFFLIKLGADPMEFRLQPTHELQLDDRELAAVAASKLYFAPLANLMAADFQEAFGIFPINTVDLMPSATIVLKPNQVFLNGRLWSEHIEIKLKMPGKDELERVFLPRKAPPVQLSSGLAVSFSLSPAGFCTPDTSLVMIQGVRQRYYNTWSPDVAIEYCIAGRMRPGNIFVLIERCMGYDAKSVQYYDWRVTSTDILLAGNLLNPASIKSSLGFTFAGDMGSDLAGLLLQGGFSTATSIAAMSSAFHGPQKIFQSRFLGLFADMALTSMPLMGLTAAHLASNNARSFQEVLASFTKHLKDYGIIGETSPPTQLGFTLNAQSILRASVVHRLQNAPILDARGNQLHMVTKSRRFLKFNFEGYFRADIELPLPGVFSLSAHGFIGLTWDLTPYANRVLNARRFKVNQERVRKCVECIDVHKKAFCDLRPVLESTWDLSKDTCVDDTPTQRDRCHKICALDSAYRGRHCLRDDKNQAVTGEFIGKHETSAACHHIDFSRFNSEVDISRAMNRFQRRVGVTA